MPEGGPSCAGCARPFQEKDRVAGISARIMGDECTDAFYWCEACEVYTVRLYREVFCGPETARNSEPIPREEGDRRLAAIRLVSGPVRRTLPLPRASPVFRRLAGLKRRGRVELYRIAPDSTPFLRRNNLTPRIYP